MTGWLNDYKSPYWLTFKQIKKLRGSVKAGEHGTPIVYYKTIEEVVENDKGEEVKRTRWICRYYTVFNLEQTTGIKAPDTKKRKINPIKEAEAIVKGYKDKPKIIHRNGTPYYSPTEDLISLPEMSDYEKEEYYYSTLFHEMVHSTGHKSRLNRIKDFAMFGSSEYSKEELVAELGAMFLSNKAGIERFTRKNNTAYINGWIKQLRNNVRWIVEASGKAQKAVDYILRG